MTKMNHKRILKPIGDGLLLAVALAVFVVLAITLAVGATLLLVFIGRWTGLGNDIFVYAVLFIAIGKAWDALAWVVGKIADWVERKKEREYFERINNKEL